jgi:hypothetical protein
MCRVEQKFLGPFHPVFQQPAVRRLACALLEGSGKVTDRQAALAGDQGQGDLTGQLSAHQFLCAALLPGCKAAARGWRVHFVNAECRHGIVGE